MHNCTHTCCDLSNIWGRIYYRLFPPLPLGKGVRWTGKGFGFTLAGGIMPHSTFTNSCNRGFTLAEVLITLGIIGIVAAMTLPSLISKHNNNVLHTQFLKTYSDLNNASKLFLANEGQTVYEYSLVTSSSNVILKKYMSYFKSAKIGRDQVDSNVGEDQPEESVKYKNILGYSPKNLKGASSQLQPCDQSVVIEDLNSRLFVLDDPITAYPPPILRGPKLCVDINGRKKPNKYGYDWFVFVFTKEGNVIPFIGTEPGYLTNWDLADPSKYCNYTTDTITYTCAYYALKDKHPLDKTKTYWKDFLK